MSEPNPFDDGLEGVDNFESEPNPFEDPDLVVPEVEGESYGATTRDTDPVPVPVIETDAPKKKNELPPGLLNYYSQYFQLTFEDFKKTFLRALSPTVFENNSAEESPDLYGALWVTAAVVLTRYTLATFTDIFVTELIHGQALGGHKNSDNLGETWSDSRVQRFVQLVYSLWIFYGYTFVAPLICHHFVLKGSRSAVLGTATQLISVYGYTNGIWLPIFVLVGVMSHWGTHMGIVRILELALVAIGGIYSGYSIYVRVKGPDPQPAHVLPAVFSMHTLFCALIAFALTQ